MHAHLGECTPLDCPEFESEKDETDLLYWFTLREVPEQTKLAVRKTRSAGRPRQPGGTPQGGTHGDDRGGSRRPRPGRSV